MSKPSPQTGSPPSKTAQKRPGRLKVVPATLKLERLLYPYGEAAHLLSVSAASIQKLVQDRQLESVNIGLNQPRITASSLLGYIENTLRKGKAGK